MSPEILSAVEKTAKSSLPINGRLQDEAREELSQPDSNTFQIVCERRTGSGWRAADGRIVTSFSVIEGGREIFAVQNGRRYRLGGNVQIDDIANLAVLEFIDGAPSDSGGVRLATSRPANGDSVTVTASSVSGAATAVRMATRADIRQYADSPLRMTVPFDSPTLKDALAYVEKPVLELKMQTRLDGLAGALASNSAGEAVGIVDRQGSKGTPFVVPAGAISELLNRKPEESKFEVAATYENGLQRYLRDWSRAPGRALMSTAWPVGTALMQTCYIFGKTPVDPHGLGPLVFLSTLVGYRTFSDLSGLSSSTGERDRLYYKSAVATDAVTVFGLLTGALPNMRRLAIGATLLGLGARAACELIPNKYAIQSVTRRDGNSRPPFKVETSWP